MRRASIATAVAIITVVAAADSIESQEWARRLPNSRLEERVDVRLVQLALFAVDSSGRPVTDLDVDEIVVTDGHKRIEPAFLEPLEAEPFPTVPAKLFVDVPGGPGQPIRTNGGGRAHYVLFIDVENEPSRPSRLDAERIFSQGGFEPSDQVAVLSYDGESHLETPFTSDREEILEAVATAYRRERHPRRNVEWRMRVLVPRLKSSQDWVRSGALETHDQDRGRSGALGTHGHNARLRARELMRALESAVRYAGGLEGRKVVLAFTNGTALDPSFEMIAAENYARGIGSAPPLTPVEFLDRTFWHPISSLAVEQGVTLQFISQPPTAGAPAPASEDVRAYPATHPIVAARAQAQKEMSGFATPTGGRLVVEQDPHHGLERTLELERSGYVLGYYLDKPPNKNSLRRVKVRSTRRGVDISVPHGYYRFQEPSRPVEGALALAPPTILSDGRRRVSFTVAANPRELKYRVGKEGAYADLTVETTLFLADGRPLVRTYHFVNHAYDRKTWRTKDVALLQISGWVEVPAGSYDLRVVIRNPRCNCQGTYARTVLVP